MADPGFSFGGQVEPRKGFGGGVPSQGGVPSPRFFVWIFLPRNGAF